jgi:hypothetical protein
VHEKEKPVVLAAIFFGLPFLALLLGLGIGGIGNWLSAPPAHQQWPGAGIRAYAEAADDDEESAGDSRERGSQRAAVLEQDRTEQERIDEEYIEAQRATAIRQEQAAYGDQEEENRLAAQYSLEAST